MCLQNSCKSFLGFGLCLLLAFTPAAQGFKISTHIYLAKQVLEDIQDDGHLTLMDVEGNNFHTVPVDERVRLSITSFPGAFLLGTTGADIYPDLIAGQMTTHPGLPFVYDPKSDPSEALISDLRVSLNLDSRIEAPGWQTDDWLYHVRKRAYELTEPGAASAQIAFAYGYLLHAAMDTWAHSYVNTYTGDAFSILENQSVAARHTVLENFIKSRHETLVPAAEPITQLEAARGARKGLQAPMKLGDRQPDFLTGLGAPAWFVRRVIILDPHAAEQHARSPAALPMWAMWAWWQHNNYLMVKVNQLRPGINAEFDRLSARVDDAQVVWNALDTAKNKAVDDAALVYNTLGGLETAALGAGTALVTETNNVIGWITNNFIANAAYQAADEALSEVLSYLPGFMLESYNKAKTADVDTNKAWNTAKENYQELIGARDELISDLEDETRELNLRKAALSGINVAKNVAWAGIDEILKTRRSNIEQSIDAYIKAFEETGKEIMRPHGSRFDPAGSPMWPVKFWAACWGPAFGLPAPTLVNASCQRLGTNYTLARQHITYLKNNLFVPDSLKDDIGQLEDHLNEALADALPVIGGIMARLVPSDSVGTTLAGSSEFASTLWDHSYDGDDLDQVYGLDGSGRNLPKYNASKLVEMLKADGLPMDTMPGKETFDSMLGFTPFRNAFHLSKLTLMTGKQLNQLAESKSSKSSVAYSSRRKSTVPRYADNAPAGEVLMGAIRSIDGNHQWMDSAPRLPRDNPEIEDSTNYATDGNCRHFGYPVGKNYTLSSGLDSEQSKQLDESLCQSDNLGFGSAKKYPAKVGFRFWQDTVLRQKVFNCLFQGPLSQGVCNEKPGQALGCYVDPYPSAYPKPGQDEDSWSYQADCGSASGRAGQTKTAISVRQPSQRQQPVTEGRSQRKAQSNKPTAVESKAARSGVTSGTTPPKVRQRQPAPNKSARQKRAPESR